MKVTLNVPSRTYDNFGAPIDIFLAFLKQYNEVSTHALEIDFSQVKFVSPVLLCALSSLVQSHLLKGGTIQYIHPPLLSDARSYLSTIYFPGGFEFNTHENQAFAEQLSPYHSKNYIPIVAFPTGVSGSENNLREKILTAINSILKRQLNMETKHLQAIYYLIDELTQNIVDHSQSEKGLLLAQFYPSKNYMDICIADYGQGLYQSYISSGRHRPSTNSEALNFAVYGKSTKDLPESRGFGISTSREMLVKGLHGKFFLLSGDSFYIETTDQQSVIDLPEINSYKGCVIALRIPVFAGQNFDFYQFVNG